MTLKKSFASPSEVRGFLDALLPHHIRWKPNNEGVTRCPFHDDQNPSFSVNSAKGVWICYAGCGQGNLESLAEKLGKPPPVLARANTEKSSSPIKKKYRQHEHEYIYYDIFQSPLFLIGRDSTPSGKKIVMYHYVHDWIVGKGEYRPIPYMLPEVVSAIDRGTPILIVEGEKDVNTVMNVFACEELVATTNMGGALNWPEDDDYNGYFSGANVFIIPDNDDVGYRHANHVANIVGKHARSTRVLSLPGLPHKGDITDWFGLGHKPNELFALMRSLDQSHDQSQGELDINMPKVDLNVLRRYFDGRRFVPAILAREVLERIPIFADGNKLYTYQNGAYQSNGAIVVRQLCQNLLGNEYSSNRVDEVVRFIETEQWLDLKQVNIDDGQISVLNGLLDLNDISLASHSSTRLSTIQLPVTYDANAKCPQVEAFLGEVIPADAIPTALEFIGYCLTMNAKYEKALMLTGSGANGKSTFIKLLTSFLGKPNTTSIPLQELAESRFKRADLHGTLLNAFGDISSRQLESSSVFKVIVSGDEIDAERRGKDPFYFHPYSKLLFSANELPGSKDLNKAFLRRWIVIPFPNSFDYGRNADPDLLSKLTTAEELSGLLNLALEGLTRLQAQGQFTEGVTIRNAIDNFLIEVDSVVGFVDECCELQDAVKCKTFILYTRYRAWCEQSGIKPLGKIQFNKRLVEQFPGVFKGREYKQLEHWNGITIAVD